MKCKCRRPSANLWATKSGESFGKLQLTLSLLNAVHGGEPISHVGFLVSTECLASRRSSAISKFHGVPSDLAVRRSKASMPVLFTFFCTHEPH